MVAKVLYPHHQGLFGLALMGGLGKPNAIDVGILNLLCLELIRVERLVGLWLLGVQFGLALLKVRDEYLLNLTEFFFLNLVSVDLTLLPCEYVVERAADGIDIELV